MVPSLPPMRPEPSIPMRMAFLSAIDESLGALRVPRTVELDPRCRAVDLVKIFGRQRDTCGAKILLETLDLACAWDRDDPWLLRQQPGERDLRGGGVLALRHFPEQIDERVIRLPVLRCEARNRLPEITAIELRVLVDLPGEKSFAERTEGNETD